MASPDASGARAGETSAETAAQVTAAFRAAARARRGQHQKPVDVLRRAFASSCPGDGRASPEDFRVTATKLGLEIPVKDVLAVFDTSEHVMRDDGGKENALAGETTRSRADEEDEAASERAASDASHPNPSRASDRYLLSYQPWIDAALGIAPRARRGARSGSGARRRAEPPERADAPGSASAARPAGEAGGDVQLPAVPHAGVRAAGVVAPARLAWRFAPRKDA